MVNVTQVVRKFIERRPFIQEALSRGVINHAALAEQLLPEVEKELGEKVTFSSVNMAVRRTAELLEKKETPKKIFEKDTDIILRSNLVAMTFYRLENSKEFFAKLYTVMDFREGDFLTVTHGINELLIQTNQKHEKHILALIPKDKVRKIVRNLSSLTINIPPKAVDTVGVLYSVTRGMAWNNINIIDIVSTFREMTLIIAEDDTARSFTVLKELIKENS